MEELLVSLGLCLGFLAIWELWCRLIIWMLDR